MKLIFAIVSNDDAGMVISALVEQKFSVTKLATTGGFLKAGNTTLLMGVEDDKLQTAIDLIGRHSRKRTQPMPILRPSEVGLFDTQTVDVIVGGATIFVTEVSKFIKL